MTKTLQDLIDEALFLSTEHQARLAELTGDSDWAVDFSSPSFSLKSDESVRLTPHLLGTESEQRGSWIWAWQEMGHFPAEVVTAAVQTREAGDRLGVQELTTDELILSEGLARRLTLAAKAATGIYAHYPAAAGGGVRAWLLVDGPQFELPEPTVQRMGRVMAQALQTGTAQNHQRAVDSYAHLRGAHIAWDTDACAVITAADGAMRLWFDGQTISGIEQADAAVSSQELQQAREQAAGYRQQLRAEARQALLLAERESQEQSQAREQAEAERVAATEAALHEQESTQTAENQGRGAPAGESAGVVRTQTGGADAPFDQDPRQDAEPGLVSTHLYEEEQDSRPAPKRQTESAETRHESEAVTEAQQIVEPADSTTADQDFSEHQQEAQEQEERTDQRSALERLRAESRGEQTGSSRAVGSSSAGSSTSGSSAAGSLDAASEQDREDEFTRLDQDGADDEWDQEESPRPRDHQKKGFFKRFLGL